MKLYKNIIVTAVSAAATILVVYGGYSIYAATGEEISQSCKFYQDSFDKQFGSADELETFYQNVSGWNSEGKAIPISNGLCSYYDIKKIYHEKMNEFFNKKFADFASVINEKTVDTFVEDLRFFAPSIDCLKEENKAKCDENYGWEKRNEIETKCKDNLSTYCVSMVAMNRYLDYAEIIRRVQKSLPTPSTSEPEEYDLNTRDNLWSSMVSGIAKQKSDMEEEFGTGSNYMYGDAQKVIKGTVTAYDEYKTAYPMHIKYDKIIKDLIGYKQKLKSIRNKVMIFPTKFTDITSITCP